MLWVYHESESEVAQSCPTLCNPMDCSLQAPPSMEFSRQEYWSGLPFPSPGDLPNLGIEPGSPTLQADALPSEPPGKIPGFIIYGFYYVEVGYFYAFFLEGFYHKWMLDFVKGFL